MSQDTNTSNWLRVLLSAFFSHMRFVLLVTLACAVVAGLSSYLLPAVYSGSFSILVKAPEIDRSSIGDNADITLRAGTVEGNVIADEYHILRSEGLADTIAKIYSTDKPLPSGYIRSALPDWLQPIPMPWAKNDSARQQESLSNYFMKHVVISPEPKSDIITISMEHHDKEFLDQTLNLFAIEYLDYRKRIWFNQDAQQYFGGQADQSLQEWTDLNEELLALKSKSYQINPDLEKTGLEGQISLNISRLQALQVELEQRKEQLITLGKLPPRDAITFFNEYTKDNRLFWQLNMDVGQTKAKRQELLKDHMEGSSLVKKADFQLEGLYKEYKRLIESLIKNSISMLQTELDALTNNNEKNSSRVIELERIQQTISVLNKKISLFEQQYDVYENKTMASKVQNLSNNALGASVRIVSPPSVRNTPVWPNRKALVIIAAILGFFFSLLAVVSAWIVKDTFHFPEDVNTYLGLQVLTSFAIEQELDNTSRPDNSSSERKQPKSIPKRPTSLGTRVFSYSALLLLSTVVAGWVLGTTLWPVWKEYQQTYALSQANPAIFQTTEPYPSGQKDTFGAKESAPLPEEIGRDSDDIPPLTDDSVEHEDPLVENSNKDNPNTKSVILDASNNSESESDSNSLPEVQLAVFGDVGRIDSPASTVDDKEDSARNDDEETDSQQALQPTNTELPAVQEIHAESTEAAPESPEIVSTENETERAPSHYYLQFGSFQDKKRAKALQDKLIEKGYIVRIPTIASKASGKQWYSVRADYDNLSDAAEAREAFFREEGSRPILLGKKD